MNSPTDLPDRLRAAADMIEELAETYYRCPVCANSGGEGAHTDALGRLCVYSAT